MITTEELRKEAAEDRKGRRMEKEASRAPTLGTDYMGLLATAILGGVAALALYWGNETVAAAAIGALGGYMQRLNK